MIGDYLVSLLAANKANSLHILLNSVVGISEFRERVENDSEKDVEHDNVDYHETDDVEDPPKIVGALVEVGLADEDITYSS